MTLFRNVVMTGQHADCVTGVKAEEVTAGDLIASPFDGSLGRVKAVDADANQVHIHLDDPKHTAYVVSRGAEMLVTV